MSIAAFVNHDLLYSLFSPVISPGPWIFTALRDRFCNYSPSYKRGVDGSGTLVLDTDPHTPLLYASQFLDCLAILATLVAQTIPILLALSVSSFNTCFNLHFTSPPFLFKLFPFLFGLATACQFQDRSNRVYYL